MQLIFKDIVNLLPNCCWRVAYDSHSVSDAEEKNGTSDNMHEVHQLNRFR